MSRFLVAQEQSEEKAMTTECQRVTQFKLSNILCKGGREHGPDKPMLLQQVPRRINAPLNALVKQIVRMDAKSKFAVHTSRVAFGKTSNVADSTSLIMLHLQGGRQTDWMTLDEWKEAKRSEYDKLMQSTKPVEPGPIPARVLLCFDSDTVHSWPSLDDDRRAYEAAHPGDPGH